MLEKFFLTDEEINTDVQTHFPYKRPMYLHRYTKTFSREIQNLISSLERVAALTDPRAELMAINLTSATTFHMVST